MVFYQRAHLKWEERIYWQQNEFRYLCDHNSGVLTKASLKPAKDAMASMSMMNPATMVDMLKGNLSAVVSMAFQYKWVICFNYKKVSYFFSGFVIGKVPFPLT